MTRLIPGRLDFAALTRLHRVTPTRPEGVCPNCWKAWHCAPVPLEVGYCPHRLTAWRVKPSGEVVAVNCTRDECVAMRQLVERRP